MSGVEKDRMVIALNARLRCSLLLICANNTADRGPAIYFQADEPCLFAVYPFLILFIADVIPTLGARGLGKRELGKHSLEYSAFLEVLARSLCYSMSAPIIAVFIWLSYLDSLFVTTESLAQRCGRLESSDSA